MAFAKAPRRLCVDDQVGNRVGTKSFKIFSDNQKIDPACTVGTALKTGIRLRRKSVTFGNGAAFNTNNMKKENLRITGKGKSSIEKSEECTKVTRKALGDLSNLGGNTMKPMLSGNSTMKWKGVKCANSQRVSIGSTRVNDIAQKKSIKGQENKNTSEVGNNRIYKTGQKFTYNKTLPLGSTAGGTRKSLPEFKRTSLIDQSTKKKIHKTVKTSLQLKKPPLGRRSVSSVPSPEKAASALSLPKKVETEGLKEDTQGESSSYEKTDPASQVLDVTAKPKSKRRKSFTSLLVTGSKFKEEKGETAHLIKLPNIDDQTNQLDVAEYVDDIYQFYWTAEALNPTLGCYLSAQGEVSPVTRGILINWLIEVHFKFDLMHETLYLTMDLLDRYLSQVPIRKNEMQLIGLTALLLASKYEDYWHPRIKDLISISAESYTREQILGMERIMLKQLKFRLNAPTPYVFMLRFLKAAQSNKKLEQLAFYLIELCLVEYEALKYKPSLLCASAIYVARCTLHITPAWTLLLNYHTHYNVSEMKECSDMILRFHKAAKTGKLKVTYEKYMNPDRSNVAVLKPLIKLPL